LVIFDQNSLDAALSLGDRVAIVNGDVKIIGDNFEAGVLNAVTSKIVAVTNDFVIKTDKVLDFSSLETVGDRVDVVGSPVDLSGLKSVGDDLQLAWDGDYDFPELALVGDAIKLGVEQDERLLKGASASKGSPRIINFRNVTANRVEVIYGAYMDMGSGVYDMNMDWDGTSSTLFFPNATSVVFGDVPVYELWAGIAENVELHYDGELDNNLIVISSASSITVKASAMVGDTEIAIYALGDTDTFDEYYEKLWGDLDSVWDTDTDWFTIPTAWDSQINLPNLAAFNKDSEDIWDLFFVSHSLSAPLLVAAEKNVENLFLTQETVTLPNVGAQNFYTIGNVDVELASIDEIYPQDASDLESLKLTAMQNDLTESLSEDDNLLDNTWTNLTSLSIMGYTPEDVEQSIEVNLSNEFDGEEFPAVETLVLGGFIDYAFVGQFAELTTLTTSGNINYLEIDENDALVTLTLGHEHISGLNGASLVVTDNDALESLVTQQLDYVYYVWVYENDNLSSIDFSSMKTALNTLGEDDYVYIGIDSNDISGTFDDYVEESGTTAEQLGVVNSTDLYSLKALVDAYAEAEVSFDFDLYVDNVADLEGKDVWTIYMDADGDLTWTWSSEPGVINFDDYYSNQ
jgi:hypothetical protein